MSLAGVVGENRGQRGAEVLELCLGNGVEERHGGDVGSLGRVVGVDLHSRAGEDSLATGRDSDITEEILGVLQVGLLLGAAEALTTLSLGLLLARVVGIEAGTLLLQLGDALSLALLVLLSLLESLGLCFLGLLGLFALDLGVFGGIPGVENLYETVSVRGATW